MTCADINVSECGIISECGMTRVINLGKYFGSVCINVNILCNFQLSLFPEPFNNSTIHNQPQFFSHPQHSPTPLPLTTAPNPLPVTTTPKPPPIHDGPQALLPLTAPPKRLILHNGIVPFIVECLACVCWCSGRLALGRYIYKYVYICTYNY